MVASIRITKYVDEMYVLAREMHGLVSGLATSDSFTPKQRDIVRILVDAVQINTAYLHDLRQTSTTEPVSEPQRLEIAHTCKNQLVPLQGYSAILLGNLINPLPEEHRPDLQRIHEIPQAMCAILDEHFKRTKPK